MDFTNGFQGGAISSNGHLYVTAYKDYYIHCFSMLNGVHIDQRLAFPAGWTFTDDFDDNEVEGCSLGPLLMPQSDGGPREARFLVAVVSRAAVGTGAWLFSWAVPSDAAAI